MSDTTSRSLKYLHDECDRLSDELTSERLKAQKLLRAAKSVITCSTPIEGGTCHYVYNSEIKYLEIEIAEFEKGDK